MRTKRVLFVFGTRPEAIKMAPVIRAVADPRYGIRGRVCVTAQHREMLDQVLRVFDIRADVDLNLMRRGQSLDQLTARALVQVRKVIETEQPSMVVVQGDTSTTFAAALAAFYESVPVAHIEAGLRTGDFARPFPEEMNRVLTTSLASIHCAPTPEARRNLLNQGIASKNIHVTGNTVVDSLLEVVRNQRRSKVDYQSRFPGIDWTKRMILVTGHRRESFGAEFRNICKALKSVATTHKEVEILYPVHLNPNVQTPVRSLLSATRNIHLLPPIPYEQFVWLMNRSHLVLTDSGGVQEEAPSLGKPVLVMRTNTERPEGVKAGTVRLVGTSIDRITSEVSRLLTSPRSYLSMSRSHNPYGDGKAGGRIARILSRAMR